MKLLKWLSPLLGFLIGSGFAWFWIERFDEDWIEVESLTIEDTHAGVSPAIRIVRTIHREFIAEWTVTLRRDTGQGFVRYCTQLGQSEFVPEAVTLMNINLDWLMNVPPNPACALTIPGRYLVTATWVLHIEGQPPKVVQIESNIFEVLP